jgi:hypothetical protein
VFNTLFHSRYETSERVTIPYCDYEYLQVILHNILMEGKMYVCGTVMGKLNATKICKKILFSI